MVAAHPLQEFADTFTRFVDAVGALVNAEYAPTPVPPLPMPPEASLRFLSIENRVGEIHRIVDNHGVRLDAQLGRIMELEVARMADSVTLPESVK